MPRARHGLLARLGPVLAAPLAALLAVGFADASSPAPLAAWPVSAELLVGEVMTGSASASDEFVELYNAGTDSASLTSLEVVYVTATGGTITRKATWGDGAVLGPHRHFLLANAAGVYASAADLTYTGGLAVTGGAIVLRPTGGQPLDAIGWGDATNAFVEGAAAAAPPAGSSLERGPGGESGNWIDTNDNAADTITQAIPRAQDVLAPATPPDPPLSSPPASSAATGTSVAATTTALPAETAAPVATTVATSTPAPAVTAAPTSAATATVTPAATHTAAGTTTPTATGTASPTPTPMATLTEAPTLASTLTPGTPTTTAGRLSIFEARSQSVGSIVAVDGVVTAELGRTIDARTLVIQDDTAGIAVRLPIGSSNAMQRGDRVAVTGTLAQPYGNQLVDVARQEDVTISGVGAVPQPVTVTRLDESVEGLLVRIEGRVTSVDGSATATVSAYVTGETSIRIVALRVSGVPLDALTSGQPVTATGVVGQRLTRTTPGYRVWLRSAADLQTGPAPTPTPNATPRPTATPTAQPTRSPAATPSPPLVSISQARSRTGQHVLVMGVTAVRAGLLDAEGRRVTIEDRSGGILVRVPAVGPRPRPGDRVRVRGTVGTYYGAPQLAATSAVITARGVRLTPLLVRSAPIPERLEWRLVRVSGTIRSVRRDGKAWRVELALSKGTIPIQGEARAAIPSAKLQVGRRLTATGIARRPRSNASDRRFALIPRAASDLAVSSAPATGARSSATQSAGSAAAGDHVHAAVGGAGTGRSEQVRDVDLAQVAQYDGALVRVGGVLEGHTGFRLTLRDASGSGVVRVPVAAAPLLSELALGEPLNAIGRVTKAGRASWEVVAASPGDLARVGRLEADAATSPSATADASSVPPDGSSGRSTGAVSSADRVLGAGPIGTAGLLPPALLFLGFASAGLWAVGLYLRRRRSAEPSAEG